MKKSKFKLLACVMAVMCCMAAFSMTAFASDGGYYESNENGSNTPPSSIDSITVSTEGVKPPENQGSEALTPEGNLSLIDDILQDESYYVSGETVVKDKQFITIQSKSGNYFYIVIDRSGDTENVYFLNLVDEADLMALMEDSDTGDSLVCTCTEKCVAGDVNTTCPVCKSNMSECAGKEAAVSTPEPDTATEPDTEQAANSEKSSSGNGLLLIVLIVLLAGGGALYWFKLRKPKTNTKGESDLDNYPFDQDDEEPEETELDDAEAVEEIRNAENEGE